MGLSTLPSGGATATIGATEFSLAANANYSSGSPQTTAAIVSLWLDASNMAAGDQYRVRVYEKVKSGGTQRILDEWVLTGAQSDPIFTGPALQLHFGWDVTLQKIAGTDRSFDFSVRLTN